MPPFRVTVELFNLIVRLFEAKLRLKPAHVNANPAVSNVPAPKPKSLAFVDVNGLPSVQYPPIPLKNNLPAKLTPLVVIVCPVVVLLNVIFAVELHTVPANSDIEPRMFNVGDVPVAKVAVPAETVMFRHAKAPVIVTV